MGNNLDVQDYGEKWDYSHFAHFPINPTLHAQFFTIPYKLPPCGAFLAKSDDKHAYQFYKNYCWLHLVTPDDTWSIAGLFPRKLFKKLLNANPIYQIPEKGEHRLSELCRKCVFDTYSLYKIMAINPATGISIIDLTPFQYKYTHEEKAAFKNEITSSLKTIAKNLETVVDAREKYRDPNNESSPFFSQQDANAFDRGVEFMKYYRINNNIV